MCSPEQRTARVGLFTLPVEFRVAPGSWALREIAAGIKAMDR